MWMWIMNVDAEWEQYTLCCVGLMRRWAAIRDNFFHVISIV